jgi:hypothetical protein
MRILFLGSSNDAGDWVPPTQKKHILAGARLEEDLGEPVEWIVRGIWPREDLPKRVEAWIEESKPDVIYLNTGSHWFLYRSVPDRVKRLLGKVGGERLGDAGARIARSPRCAHNRPFRALRKVLQETIGGDTYFTTQQVIDRMSECLRVSVRSEGAIVVVKGPLGKRRYSSRKRAFERDERERLKLHAELERLCTQLHATYVGVGEGGVRNEAAYRKGGTVGDGLHANASLHSYEADGLYAGIRKGLEAAGRLEPAPTTQH